MPKRIRAHVNPLSVTTDHVFDGFGNDQPIYIDVGAFKGEFIKGLADKFPEANFIVFEIRLPFAKALAEQFKDQENIVVFDGDAGRNFRSIVQPCLDQGTCVKEIFVNFPDPWFKEKHKKRRFITTNFCNQLATWLPKETEIVFQTDQKFLFEETLEYLAETPYRDIKYFKDSAHGIPTNWEQSKLEAGDQIWRMRIKKDS